MSDEQKAREELRQLFANNGRNLKHALTSLAPEDIISVFKLIFVEEYRWSSACRVVTLY